MTIAAQIVAQEYKCSEPRCDCVAAKYENGVLVVFNRHHGHNHPTKFLIPLDGKPPVRIG